MRALKTYSDRAIIFCRLVNIQDMDNPEITAATLGLDSSIESLIASRFPDSERHGSVFGAYVVVKKPIRRVLEFAESLRLECFERAITLAMGISDGRLEPVRDLEQENLVGTAINYAARLAFFPDGIGRIAVKEDVAIQARNSGCDEDEWFGAKERGRVKTTNLSFRWLQRDRERRIPSRREQRPRDDANSRVVHVAVYDLKGYSGLSDEDQLELFKRLHSVVRDALELARADLGTRDWYSPAGDGGAVVFGESPRALWSFARALASYARRAKLELRIGVDRGEICVLKNFGRKPVGTPVIRADYLSSIAEIGGICLSNGYADLLKAVDYDEAEHSGLIIENESAPDGTAIKQLKPTKRTGARISKHGRRAPATVVTVVLPSGQQVMESRIADPTIIVCPGPEDVSIMGARFLLETIRSKSFPRLGLFTGRSANGVYSAFVELYKSEMRREERAVSFSNVEIFVDGEFFGMTASHENSYQHMINRDLLNRVEKIEGITLDRMNQVHFIEGSVASGSVETHCELINTLIRGRIHLQLMGIAPDGQSMFLSPGMFEAEELVQMGTSLIELSQNTYEYITPKPIVPYAFTIGSGNILNFTDQLILIAHGEHKSEIVKRFVVGPGSMGLPVAILKRHKNLTMIIDEDAASSLFADSEIRRKSIRAEDVAFEV